MVDMDKHVTAVGVLNLALGLSGLLGAPFVLISMVGGGLATGDWPPMVLVPLMGIVITLFMLVLAIPAIVVGIAILSGADMGALVWTVRGRLEPDQLSDRHAHRRLRTVGAFADVAELNERKAR